MKRIESHLYKHGGAYVARFVCHDGRRRKWPLGSNLKIARDELGRLRMLDRQNHDWDAKKRDRQRQEQQKLTVSKFIPRFLETKQGMPSYDFWKLCCNHLNRLLGSVPLEEITRSRIAQYKAIRKSEPITRQGKPVKGTQVSGSTVNREITALIGLLNLAAEDGVLERIPATRKLKEPEGHLSRERVLDADEYRALLDASPVWLRRILIAAHEACLSRVDLLTLSWDEINRKKPETAMVKLVGGRNKTKSKQKAPISPELWAVLDEIEAERRKVTSLQAPNLVFTKDGQPINRHVLRKAFERAKEKAGLKDFHFHDLRHCAVTRWALAGIPEELRKIAAGHSRGSVHQRYINPPDEEMVKCFAERLNWNFGTFLVPGQLQARHQSAK